MEADPLQDQVVPISEEQASDTEPEQTMTQQDVESMECSLADLD